MLRLFLEMSGPFWGTLISKGIVYEIVEGSWAPSMDFPIFLNFLIHLCTQLFKKNERLYFLRSWEFKVRQNMIFFFCFLGRKVKHKYTNQWARWFQTLKLQGRGGECFRFRRWDVFLRRWHHGGSWVYSGPPLLPGPLPWNLTVSICPDSGLVRWTISKLATSRGLLKCFTWRL